MEVYSEYDTTMRTWTASLGWWHSVLYCYAICVRSSPLYTAFQLREKWGGNDCILETQELARRFLTGEKISDHMIDSLYSRLEMVIPDSENFMDCSAAMDAGIIHLYTLSLLKRFDVQETHYVASYCYDLVDAAAGNEILPAGIMSPEIETAIGNHPLVQDEVRWQELGRRLIATIPEFDMASGKQFIDNWAAKPIIP
ncbi:MAG: DUF416 family protein [Pirellula sp.]|jgi:hypothetical protein